MTTKTYMAKPGEIEKQWHIIDATDVVLGRLAAKVAPILQGKHRPEFTPHVDCGDFVVIINAAKVKHTGANKSRDRVFKSYSGYPGGQKEIPLAELMAKHPDRVVLKAIQRMLPKTKLGEAMIKKVKVYAGSDHPHQAQNPQALEM